MWRLSDTVTKASCRWHWTGHPLLFYWHRANQSCFYLSSAHLEARHYNFRVLCRLQHSTACNIWTEQSKSRGTFFLSYKDVVFWNRQVPDVLDKNSCVKKRYRYARRNLVSIQSYTYSIRLHNGLACQIRKATTRLSISWPGSGLKSPLKVEIMDSRLLC